MLVNNKILRQDIITQIPFVLHQHLESTFNLIANKSGRFFVSLRRSIKLSLMEYHYIWKD
mgnify:CR=1 FL=1